MALALGALLSPPPGMAPGGVLPSLDALRFSSPGQAGLSAS